MASNGSAHEPFNGNYPAQLPGYSIDTQVLLSTILCLVFVAVLVIALHAYARYLLGHGLHGHPTTVRVLPDGTTITMRGDSGGGGGGIDPSTIAALPTFLYGEGNACRKVEAAPPECAVCLSPMEEGERVRLLPRCKHLFHVACIDEWLGSHLTCPLCRRYADPAAAGDKMEEADVLVLPSLRPEAHRGGDASSFAVTVEGTSGSREGGSTSRVEASSLHLHTEVRREWCGREGQRGGRLQDLERQ